MKKKECFPYPGFFGGSEVKTIQAQAESMEEVRGSPARDRKELTGRGANHRKTV